MDGERLLERMRTAEREALQRGGEGARGGIASVLSHLHRILNTRQGNVPIAADYGIPDFLDLLQSYPESVRAIEDSIRNAIDRYEPRLSAARVSYIPDEDGAVVLRFHITARLRAEEGRAVSFETVVGTDGRVHLR